MNILFRTSGQRGGVGGVGETSGVQEQQQQQRHWSRPQQQHQHQHQQQHQQQHHVVVASTHQQQEYRFRAVSTYIVEEEEMYQPLATSTGGNDNDETGAFTATDYSTTAADYNADTTGNGTSTAASKITPTVNYSPGKLARVGFGTATKRCSINSSSSLKSIGNSCGKQKSSSMSFLWKYRDDVMNKATSAVTGTGTSSLIKKRNDTTSTRSPDNSHTPLTSSTDKTSTCSKTSETQKPKQNLTNTDMDTSFSSSSVPSPTSNGPNTLQLHRSDCILLMNMNTASTDDDQDYASPFHPAAVVSSCSSTGTISTGSCRSLRTSRYGYDEEEEDEEEEQGEKDAEERVVEDTLAFSSFLLQRRDSLGEGRWHDSDTTSAIHYSITGGSCCPYTSSESKNNIIFHISTNCDDDDDEDDDDDSVLSESVMDSLDPYSTIGDDDDDYDIDYYGYDYNDNIKDECSVHYAYNNNNEDDDDNEDKDDDDDKNSMDDLTAQSPIHQSIVHTPVTVESLDILFHRRPSLMYVKNSNNGHLPLHLAVASNRSSYILTYLLQQHPDAISIADNNGNLPIHLAAAHFSCATASFTSTQERRLSSHQSDGHDDTLPTHAPTLPDTSSTVTEIDFSVHRMSLLHEAYPSGISSLNSYGQIPLHLAYRNVELVRYLLQQYPEGSYAMDNAGRVPFHIALENHATSSVLFLLLDEFPEAFLVPVDGKLPIQILIDNCCYCSTSTTSMCSENNGQHYQNQHPHQHQFAKDAFDVLQRMVRELPNCLTCPIYEDDDELSETLPLHYACEIGAPPEVLLYLALNYPDALIRYDEMGLTALHKWCSNEVCCNRISSKLEIESFLKFQPDSVSYRTKVPIGAQVIVSSEQLDPTIKPVSTAIDDLLPIQLACENNANLDVINILIHRSLNEILPK